MHIQTKFHGEIRVQSDQIWNFPKGIPGFEGEKEFVLLPIVGDSTFQALQSTQEPNIAFIVVNPYNLVENYSFDVNESTIELLEIQNQQHIFVLSILSVKDSFEESTINLQAPLIFQSEAKKAKQMILNDNTFTMRHPIGSKIKMEREV